MKLSFSSLGRTVFTAGIFFGALGVLKADYLFSTLSTGLNAPNSIAVDSSGNAFVAESSTHTIKKITPQGTVSVFAGMTGVPGHADGDGTAAQFDFPQGVAVDATGYIYVADTGNNVIRKITPTGSVSTLAGTSGGGSGAGFGSADGSGGAASFHLPYALAVDDTGNIYVADTFNQTVRKVTSAGVVTTLAGFAGVSGSSNGTGSAARFQFPRGIAVDAFGNIYVADSGNHTIRKISGGVVSTYAGSPGVFDSTDGVGSAARFAFPHNIAADATGNLYVADTSNNSIRKIFPDATVVTIAGAQASGNVDGYGAVARFSVPDGIAVSPANNLLVADSGNNSIRVGLIDLAPSITIQPLSQDNVVGQPVAFSITVSGRPAPALQWKKNGINLVGATSASLSFPSVQLSDTGIYSVVATNTLGSIESNVVFLSAHMAGPGTFSGTRDLVWQNHSTGERVIWLMNGTSVAGGVSLGTVSAEWEIAVTGDFNADGKTDLVWQNTATGERAIWLMNGTAVSSGVGLGLVPVEWVIAAAGDFNADGKSDLVWQNTLTGERSIWLMNGTNVISGVGLGTVATEWSIAGAGDFNSDGQTDIYWQNTVTGQHLVWYMNGTTVSSGAGLGTHVQYSVAGVGDYNSDGKSDLLITNNTTGERSIWLLNGTTVSNTVSLATLSLDWVLNRSIPRRTHADFNRDGKTDIVWQNSLTGERLIWLMNGSTASSGVSLSTISVNWTIAAIGDFNNDGNADLVWQNTVTGERSIWLMNGAAVSSGVGLGVTPVAWSIGASGDFNNDGKADLLVQNTSTNEAAIWLMDGTTKSSTVSLGVQASLRIATVGDFNNDGKSDIVWRNPVTGEHRIWLMNGTVKSSEVSLGTFGPEWSITGSGDFNQDGKSDLLWQNSSTGERLMWLMNGTSVSAGIGLGVYPVEWSLRN